MGHRRRLPGRHRGAGPSARGPGLPMSSAQYFCDFAWLGGPSAKKDVLVYVSGDRIVGLGVEATAPATAVHLRGLTLPGLANCHSHAFHRALRGRAQAGRGTFWTWRDEM